MDVRQWVINKLEKRSGINGGLSFFGSGLSTKEMQLSAVFRCVEVLSDSVAMLPLNVFQRDTDKGYLNKIDEHPLWSVMRKPSTLHTRYSFVKSMVQDMLLHGNGYALIERDRGGNPVKVIKLNFGECTPIYDSSKDALYYEVLGRGRYDYDDIVHLKNYSTDGITGISTISFAANSIKISNSSEAHASAFFDSGAAVNGVLSTDGRLTEVQRDQNRKAWQETHGSGKGGVAVLDGGMKYTAISVSPVDAQLLESRQFNVVDICRFFGVSPIKAFDLSKSNYSTVEATQLAFLTDTLSPLLQKIELELSTKLFKVVERRNHELRFDVNYLLRADKNSQSNWLKNLIYSGVMSRNEARQSLDLPHIDGGDVYLLQGNMATLEEIEGRAKKDVSNQPINE